MKILSLVSSFLLIVAFCLPSTVFCQETITLTTYYPAPFGVYSQLRSQRVAIGPNYFQQALYPWDDNGTIIGNEIPQDVNVIVEGKVGIGTHAPGHPLEVYGSVLESDSKYRNRLIVLNNAAAGARGGSSIDLRKYNGSGQLVSGNIYIANWDPDDDSPLDDWIGLTLFRHTGAGLVADNFLGLMANGVTWLGRGPGGKVGVGTKTPSTGQQALKLDVEGAVGATWYCDQNGNNCVQPPISGGSTVNSYIGNGGTRVINLGFQPQAMLITEQQSDPIQFTKTITMPGASAFQQGAGQIGRGQSQYKNTITLISNGFRVTSDANANGRTYHYIAWR